MVEVAGPSFSSHPPSPLHPASLPFRLGNVIPGCLLAQPFRCLLPRGPVSLDGFTWVLILQQSPLA